MKNTLFRLLTVFGLLTTAARAEEPAPPTFVPANGLQLSLTTAGYKFIVGDANTAPPTAAVATKLGAVAPTRDGFAACALLANSSRTAIPFEFDDVGAAALRFKFSVLDAAGKLVWQSDADLVSPQVITTDTLNKGERWKRLVQVPLKVNGAWLTPGIYTLTAGLAATPSVSAATIFEVSNLPTPPPPLENGILGHVLAAQATGDPIPVKAYVVIHEVRPSTASTDHPEFSWAGTTDDSGNFKVATPVGTFLVSASPFSNVPAPVGSAIAPTPVVTATVTVTSGKFSEVTLTLPKKSDPPPPKSGIRGLVLIGPISPTTVAGASNEKPLPGALVTIDSVNATATSISPLPGFHWEGKSNSEGRFEATTPPGRYHVTARQAASNTLSGASASAEVVVTDGKISEVTLHIDSGIR